MPSHPPPTPQEVREFVIAGHGNLGKVKLMLAAQPSLLNMANQWSPGDYETAIQAAAHVGNRDAAEYLLAQGAPLEICTAAMLGRTSEVERLLQEKPERINEHGAHRISLLAHAALSGDIALVESLFNRGAVSGAAFALSLAVMMNDEPMARWLLEHASPDLTWKNYQEKTALQIATDNSNTAMVELLRSHGADQ